MRPVVLPLSLPTLFVCVSHIETSICIVNFCPVNCLGEGVKKLYANCRAKVQQLWHAAATAAKMQSMQLTDAYVHTYTLRIQMPAQYLFTWICMYICMYVLALSKKLPASVCHNLMTCVQTYVHLQTHTYMHTWVHVINIAVSVASYCYLLSSIEYWRLVCAYTLESSFLLTVLESRVANADLYFQ